MPQLDNLLEKINEESLESAKKIVNDANTEAEDILKHKKEEANILKDKIIESSIIESVHLKEILISGKKLEIRDDKLGSKQKIIEKVFKLTLQKLSALSTLDFSKFVESTLRKARFNNKSGILIMPEKYHNIDTGELSYNTDLILTIDKNQEVKDGFIFVSEGIEYNNTFSAILDFNRDDFELSVSQELFKEV